VFDSPQTVASSHHGKHNLREVNTIDVYRHEHNLREVDAIDVYRHEHNPRTCPDNKY
jgi:hypothetical protein